MSDVQIAKSTAFNFLTIGCNAFASLFVTALIARWLAPQAMGTYSLLTFFFTMAALLVNMGLATTTMKYMAEALGRADALEAAGVLAHGLRRVALNGALVTAAWLAATPWIERAYPAHGLAGFLGVAAAVVLPSAVMALLTAALQGLQRYAQVAVATAAYTGLLTALTLLALASGWGIGGLLLAMALANAATVALYLHFLQRWQPGWWRHPVAPDRQAAMRRYGASLMVLILLDAIVWQRSGVFFLGAWAPAQDVAFYAMAFGLATMAMRLIPGTLVGLLLPSMSRSFGSGDLGHVAAIYHLAGRWMAILALPVAVGGAALGPALVTALYGPAYAPMTGVLGVLLASGALVMIFGFPASSVLYAVEGQRHMVRVGLAAAALNVALALALIPPFGAMGAAAATALAQLASLGPGAYFAGRMLGGVGPAWRRFPATLASALAMGVPVWGIAQLLPPLGALLVGVPVGAAVYGLHLWLLKALDPEDWRRIAVVAARLPVIKRLVPAPL